MTSDNAIDVDFNVPLKHQLRFTRNVLADDRHVLADLLQDSNGQRPRVQFWIDANLAATRPELHTQLCDFSSEYSERFTLMGMPQTVESGESVKNDIHILERILGVIHQANLDRRSYIVVLGGGAVLDAVGFAAAIAHRGIRLIRLPSTTLAQADSGIGVKNAVNLFHKKNWVGTFSVPWAVVNDATMLQTLPDRDFVSGFSEAVKVALLKDPEMFQSLCRLAPRIRRRDMEAAESIIRQSAIHHLQHITTGGDPFEALEARPLDFGHWSAHRLEVLSDFELRHGESVAIGVAVDTVYSSRVHGFPESATQRVLTCLEQLGLALDHHALRDTEALFAGLEEFRQHLGGRLTVTMLTDIGRPIDVHQIDHDHMREAIQVVANYMQAHSAATSR